MEIKDKHIAVMLDNDGKCKMLAKIKVVSEKEYNRLANELEQFNNEQEKKNNANKKSLEEHTNEIKKLKERDLLLAKSIYDNFVDRGLLNDNEKFQRDFFDFVFNNCKLKIENTPSDFQIILRKVGNL